MKGGPRTLKAAKAKLARRKKLVEKADDEVLDLKKTLYAGHVALKAAKGKAIVARENYEKAEFEFEVINRKTNIEEIFWRFSHMGRQILEELDDQSLSKFYEVNKWWQKFMDGQKTVYIRKIQKCIGVSNVATRWKLEKESLEKLKEIAHYILFEYPESFAAWKPTTILNGLVSSLVYCDYDSGWKPDTNLNDLYLTKLIIDNTKDPETLNATDPENTVWTVNDKIDSDIGYCSVSVLHKAALNNNVEVYKMIMDKIKDKNPSNSKGYTPLHFAARRGNFSMVELLINNIEDFNPKNNIGETPLDLALMFEKKDVSELIERAISKQIEQISSASKRRRLQ